MRIIIAGSRDFTDYKFLKKKLDDLTVKLNDIVVVSGGAKGVDKMGERWAFENGLDYMVYHADWKRKGKSAGVIRNHEMVENADALIAFHKNNSPGTKDVIERARKARLKVRVIKVR